MIDTPIAELGFFGVAVGAAMMGMRPIADVQYGDFLFLASDQIINNAAKMRYMSGGRCQVPLVMRAPVGATGRGSQHAQNMERYFTGVPGLKVVAVSNAYDAKGILKAAVRDDNPVLIFEHKLLYGSKGARTESGAVDATSEIPDQDYVVPLDQAAVRRSGSEVTILSWLLMLHFSLDAAQQLAGRAYGCGSHRCSEPGADRLPNHRRFRQEDRSRGDCRRRPENRRGERRNRGRDPGTIWATSQGAQLSESLRLMSQCPSLRFLKMPIARAYGKSSKRCEKWFGRSLTLPEAASRLTLLRNVTSLVIRF